MSDPNFSLNRVGRLIWSDLVIHRKRNLLLLLSSVLLSGSLLYVLLFDSDISRYNGAVIADHHVAYAKFHLSFFPFSLLFSGFVFTSLAFRELSRPDSRSFYLALPAGHLEKVVAKWVLTALVYPLVWLLIYQLLAPLSYWSFRSFSHFKMVRLDPFDPWIWWCMGVYLLTQSVFFFGAVVRPRYSLLWTLVLIAVGVSLAVLLYEFTLYQLLPLIDERAKHLVELAATRQYRIEPAPTFQNRLANFYPTFMVYLFGLLITPMLLLISYWKLKERQL